MKMRMAGCSLGVVGRVGLLLASVVAGVAGCGGGGDLGPMTGRQVIQGRDVADLYFWRDRTLSFTRATADPSQPEPQDFLVWPLDDPSPTVALTGVDWDYPSWPFWFSGDLLLTGRELELIYSIESRQAVNLATYLPLSTVEPPSYRDVFASVVVRSDGRALAKRADNTIVTGVPPEMRAFTLPPGTAVGGMTFLGQDLALLLRDEAAGTIGISRLDTSSGALTPLSPSGPAGEWAGLTGFCDDVQPPARCGFFGTLGCAINEPPCPNGERPPCRLLYVKADPERQMKPAAYVLDAATGTATRLAGDGVAQFFASRNNHVLVWGNTDVVDPVTRYWSFCGETQGECPFRIGAFYNWRPDGGAFAMYGLGDVMSIVDVANGACISPDPNKTYSVVRAQWSPSSDRLTWVAANDAQETSETLWVGDRDGGAPVALSGGPSLTGTFSSDGQRIFVSHDGQATASLGWIDLTTSPPVEHVLSSNRGDIGLLGDRRAMFIDHYNAQDGNGDLVLVDLTTGAQRTLARAVTDVAVSGGSEAEGTDVAYTVRGRAAASRDGLWLMTLPP